MKATWYQQESQAVGAPPASSEKHQTRPLVVTRTSLWRATFRGELGQSVVLVSEGVNRGVEVGAANVNYSL